VSSGLLPCLTVSATNLGDCHLAKSPVHFAEFGPQVGPCALRSASCLGGEMTYDLSVLSTHWRGHYRHPVQPGSSVHALEPFLALSGPGVRPEAETKGGAAVAA